MRSKVIMNANEAIMNTSQKIINETPPIMNASEEIINKSEAIMNISRVVDKPIRSYKKFRNLYWASKNYEKNPVKYRPPHKTCTADIWNRWCSNEKLRFYVAYMIGLDCYYNKRNREIFLRIMNDVSWDLELDENNDWDYDYFNLNNLFFENNGDIWNVYQEDCADLFDLNYLFRNFSIRPECDSNCCKKDCGPFESDSDTCRLCVCCRFLNELDNIQDPKRIYPDVFYDYNYCDLEL